MVLSHGRQLQISAVDAQLRDLILTQMQRHGRVDVTAIGVLVRGGQVLLWGSVASEQARSLAGAIAAKITGRTSVINQIEVYRTTEN